MADDATEEQKGEKPKTAAFWRKQLAAAEKREEKFRKAGDEVICRYLDDRENESGDNDDARRVNILWATTETQKGMLFSRLGNPDVGRLFPKPGRDNKIARTASMVIERTLTACGHRYDAEEEIKSAVEDQLLPGRGVCWLEYEPTIEEVEETPEEEASDTDGENDSEDAAEEQTEPAEQAVKERIVYQEARACHVDWKDFRHGSAKTWKDVPWVARPLLYLKQDLERDFPDHAEKIPLNYVLEEGRDLKADEQGDFKRARLWEIWYKPTKIRVYIADDYEYELKRDDDPYKLQNFFPVPRPLYGVKTSSTLTPRAEFLQWQDQAAELDRVNTRIWRLLERMKYCGIYDASGDGKEVLSQLGSLRDGQFLGVKNLRNLAGGEGLAAAFQVRDLAPIAAAIQGCAQRAIEVLNYIYEVTGISDLMRGSTDADETYGAQNLKATFGSQRQQQKQSEVQRFVRDIFKMKGELIAEHFEREVLEEMSGVRLPLQADIDQAKQALDMLKQAQQAVQQAQQQPQQGQPAAAPMQPSPQAIAILQAAAQDPEQVQEWQEIADACSWEEVSGVLRSDDRRNYKIDVQSDLTAMDETIEEKQLRVEYMNLSTTFLTTVGPIIMGNPPLVNLARELFMHTTRAFKTARTLEETIDDAFAQLAKMPPPGQGDGQDPVTALETKKLQAEVQGKQLDLEAQRQKQAYEQQDREHKLATDQAKAQIDNSMAAIKAQAEQKQFLLESYLKERELELKNRQLDLQALELESKYTGSAQDQQPLDVPKANFDGGHQSGEADKFAELMNELRGHHANVLAQMKSQNAQNGVSA